MVGLLDVPRELRDNIIDLVLLTEHNQDKSNPAQLEKLPEVARESGYPFMMRVMRRSVLYETPPKQPSADALLLVNRQLHSETRQALARIIKKGLCYSLDLTFFEEKQVRHRWKVVPVRSTSIDTVDVTVRIAGHMKSNDCGYRKGRNIWKGGVGGPPAVVWPFYIALERFLRFGTVGNCIYQGPDWTSDEEPAASANGPGYAKGERIDRHVTVKHLVLDFITPSNTSGLAEAGEESRRAWRRARVPNGRWNFTPEADEHGLRGRVMRPEWLAEYLLHYFETLLSGRKAVERWGKILSERLDQVTFKVDGQVLKELAVAELNKHA